MQFKPSNNAMSLPTAIPKSPLELDVINLVGYGQTVQPRSIGYDDGYVYGNASTNDKIFKTNGGFSTPPSDLEYGQQFDGLAGFTGSIWGVFKTYAGYVVIEKITATTSAIWFSDAFGSGFTKVLNLDRGIANMMNMSFYNNGEHDTVCLVSEYVQGAIAAGSECRLFASFDGGATWAAIKTLPAAINGAYNSHWHTQVYDPYDARIYASAGDADNAMLYYSDDLGQNWSTVPLASYTLPSHHPQPTMMIPAHNKIILGADNGLAPSVMSLVKDNSYKLKNTETFKFQHEYSVYPGDVTMAAGKYARPPYAIDENEIYFLVPGFTGHRQAYVVGSGDAGQTWHKVGTLNLSRTVNTTNTPNGIVGPDINGYMYVYFAANHIARFKKAEWLFN